MLLPSPDHPDFNPDKTPKPPKAVYTEDLELEDLYSEVYQLQAMIDRLKRWTRNTVIQMMEREKKYLETHDEIDLNDPICNRIAGMKQYGLALLAEMNELTLSQQEDKLYWELLTDRDNDKAEEVDVSGFM